MSRMTANYHYALRSSVLLLPFILKSPCTIVGASWCEFLYYYDLKIIIFLNDSRYFVILVQSLVSGGSMHFLKRHNSYLDLSQIQLRGKGVNALVLVPGQGFGAHPIIWVLERHPKELPAMTIHKSTGLCTSWCEIDYKNKFLPCNLCLWKLFCWGSSLAPQRVQAPPTCQSSKWRIKNHSVYNPLTSWQ